MTSHVGMMALFALCVSIVFAVLNRDDAREQLRLGARLFAAFFVGACLTGWIMLAFFG